MDRVKRELPNLQGDTHAKVGLIVSFLEKEQTSLQGYGLLDGMSSLVGNLVKRLRGGKSSYNVKPIIGKLNGLPGASAYEPIRIYCLLVQMIRGIDTFPPVPLPLVDKMAKQAASKNDDGDTAIKNINKVPGVDASQKSFFMATLVTTVERIRSGDVSGANHAFETFQTVALMDIQTKEAGEDYVGAMNEANGFASIAQTLESFASGKNLKTAISPKQFNAAVARVQPRAATQATAQPAAPTSFKDAKAKIEAAMAAAFDPYYQSSRRDIDNIAAASSVDVSDSDDYMRRASAAMLEAFRQSFDQGAYDKYAFNKGAKKPYSPEQEAKVIGRATAAFSYGCYVNFKRRGNTAFASGVDQKLKDLMKATTKVASRSPVCGASYYEYLKSELQKAGFETDDIDSMDSGMASRNISDSIRKRMFTTFYEKFKNQFIKKYNPGNIISSGVFTKYPTAQTPFVDAPYFLAAQWRDIALKMQKNPASLSEHEKNFYFMYYMTKGDPNPIVGLTAPFVEATVEDELKEFNRNVDHYAIDAAKEKKDPNADNAVVIQEKEAADIMVDRLVDAVVRVAENAPHDSKRPGNMASSVWRTVTANDEETIDRADISPADFGGMNAGDVNVSSITRFDQLPEIPDLNFIEEMIGAEEGRQERQTGDGEPSGEPSGEPTEGNISRGSVFYAFCCGIMTAYELRVKIGAMDDKGDPIRLNEDDESIRLVEDEGGDAGTPQTAPQAPAPQAAPAQQAPASQTPV